MIYGPKEPTLSVHTIPTAARPGSCGSALRLRPRSYRQAPVSPEWRVGGGTLGTNWDRGEYPTEVTAVPTVADLSLVDAGIDAWLVDSRRAGEANSADHIVAHLDREAAFATLLRDRADALFVAPDGFFTSRRVQFATLAARHAIPGGLYQP